jgi:hypothetical protein
MISDYSDYFENFLFNNRQEYLIIMKISAAVMAYSIYTFIFFARTVYFYIFKNPHYISENNTPTNVTNSLFIRSRYHVIS